MRSPKVIAQHDPDAIIALSVLTAALIVRFWKEILLLLATACFALMFVGLWTVLSNAHLG
jgi:hypothetical protein